MRHPGRSDLFGAAETALLDSMPLEAPYRSRVGSLRRIIAMLGTEIERLDRQMAKDVDGDAGYHAIQARPGVGPVLAAYSSPRSETSPGSDVRSSCAHGPG